jgi:hypothetical protein
MSAGVIDLGACADPLSRPQARLSGGQARPARAAPSVTARNVAARNVAARNVAARNVAARPRAGGPGVTGRVRRRPAAPARASFGPGRVDGGPRAGSPADFSAGRYRAGNAPARAMAPGPRDCRDEQPRFGTDKNKIADYGLDYSGTSRAKPEHVE